MGAPPWGPPRGPHGGLRWALPWGPQAPPGTNEIHHQIGWAMVRGSPAGLLAPRGRAPVPGRHLHLRAICARVGSNRSSKLAEVAAMSASTRSTSAPGRVETTKFAVIEPQPDAEPGPEEGPGAAAGPGVATAAGDAPPHQHQWPRCIFCPRPLPRDGRRVRDSRNQLVPACCYLCAGRAGEPPSEWQRAHTRNCQGRADRV